ncbi:MAG: hypothetical protein IJ985_03620 [Akkermansia sp.]|nr:hypothetical protein [Akkermansia sp.]
MAMHQDHFSMLSELERLAAMALDPVRVHELGADRWPVAMLAAALIAGGDESRQAELMRAYAIFVQKNPPATRAAGLVQLSRFVCANKGNGWRGFMPCAMADPDAALRRKAAVYMATLATPGELERFTGVAELVRRLSTDEASPATVLDALLSLGDMRFLHLLERLYERPVPQLSAWLGALDVVPNHLSCNWLLGVLEAHPTLASDVVAVLQRTAAKATVLIDLTLPVPSWAFKSAAPQPLHGWTPQEYVARMQSRLQPHLSGEQMNAVRAAFGMA